MIHTIPVMPWHCGSLQCDLIEHATSPIRSIHTRPCDQADQAAPSTTPEPGPLYDRQSQGGPQLIRAIVHRHLCTIQSHRQDSMINRPTRPPVVTAQGSLHRQGWAGAYLGRGPHRVSPHPDVPIRRTTCVPRCLPWQTKPPSRAAPQ